MANRETLERSVKEWLEKERNLDPSTMFGHTRRDNENDCMLTFFQRLISKCIIRHVPSYASPVYTFSVPGRKLMSNDAARTAFISEFMRFLRV